MSVCNCGHALVYHHPAGVRGCFGSALSPDGYGGFGVPFCQCPGLQDAILPASGERPVFGVHRLPTVESKWTTESDAERERKFREWVKGAPGDQV